MNKLLAGIPQKRLVIYLVILGLLPLLIGLNSLMSSNRMIAETNATLRSTYEKALLSESRQAGNKAVKSVYSDANHRYIDDELETIKLLQSETGALERLVSDEGLVDEALVKRLDFLKTENKLQFSESSVVGYSDFQETQETLSRTVEVDEADIAVILSRIEGTSFEGESAPANRPQLIITRFKIDRKSDDGELFVLNLALLKREFL